MEITETSAAERMKRNGFILTGFKNALTWARQNALSAMSLDLGCCSIGVGHETSFSIADAGMETVLDPRHADLLIVSGALANKAAPVLKRIYDQMPSPKCVIAVGSCAASGGPFGSSYAVVSSVAEIIPVDVFIPGCPPSVDAFRSGMELLQKKIKEKSAGG